MEEILERLYVFVMAGGSGERFWPMSRTRTPKHLLRVVGEETLLGEAVARARALVPEERVYVLTNEAQVEGCLAALPGFGRERVLAEPAKRDTAPACALATGYARSRRRDALCALFPADAVIRGVEAFCRNVRDAVELAAKEDAFVTFGIAPTYPATGFGYLELGEGLGRGREGSELWRVKRFVEKPNLEVAREYVASGRYAWNSGMFVWQAEFFLGQARMHAPELARFIEDFPQGEFGGYLRERFVNLPKISVDYALMEKATAVCAVRTEFAWDDLGTWTALPAHLGQDGAGNTVRGRVAMVDSRNNIVMATGRVVALCGVEGLVVVETGDAVLVCHRDAVQRIKELQPQLPEELR